MKRMPWWGWLVFLGLPVLIPLVLVYSMFVALPLSALTSMCYVFGWKAPSWTYLLTGHRMTDKSLNDSED